VRSNAFILIALSGACYYQTPLHDLPPATDTHVTVTLEPRGTFELSNVLGPGAQALDGSVLGGTADTLMLSVSHVARFEQHGEDWHGEHVALPRTFVARVEQRRFSKMRTGLLVFGFAAAVVVADKILSTNVCAPVPYGPRCQ